MQLNALVRPVLAALLVSGLGPLSFGQTAFSRSLAGARDVTGQGFAFVDVSGPRESCFVGQCVRVRLRFGVEEEFLRKEMVQPFGVILDVPVQLSAPWLEGLPEASADSEGERPTFALNESLRRAAREEVSVVDGRRFLTFAHEVIVLPTTTGPLRLPGPALAFAYATRFEETFVDGRAPVDRVDAFVSGETLTLEVRPLPEAGRPPEFTGAVGSFSVRAEAEPSVVALGESLKFQLIVEGVGNLSLFVPPRWTEIGGFRVLGMIDEKGQSARTLTYDLAPISTQAWQVPAVPFAYFDPGPPEGYRVVRTQPIDVVVLQGKSEAPADAGSVQRSGWLLIALAALLVLLLLLGARRRGA